MSGQPLQDALAETLAMLDDLAGPKRKFPDGIIGAMEEAASNAYRYAAARLREDMIRPARLDRPAVDTALRQVVAHIDYDTHKYLECDEQDGKDTYPEHVDRFITEYRKAQS